MRAVRYYITVTHTRTVMEFFRFELYYALSFDFLAELNVIYSSLWDRKREITCKSYVEWLTLYFFYFHIIKSSLMRFRHNVKWQKVRVAYD